MVDSLVWEGRFSIISQISLGKGIFTNAPDYINTLLQKCYLVWDNIFWWLTDWSGKGDFLLLARLVWQRGFSLTPQTRLLFYCENDILIGMIFFGC